MDRDSDPDIIMADALFAAADQLPTTAVPARSQIFYNGIAMAANLLRAWAAELTHHES
jgi:hypothetical protein